MVLVLSQPKPPMTDFDDWTPSSRILLQSQNFVDDKPPCRIEKRWQHQLLLLHQQVHLYLLRHRDQHLLLLLLRCIHLTTFFNDQLKINQLRKFQKKLGNILNTTNFYKVELYSVTDKEVRDCGRVRDGQRTCEGQVRKRGVEGRGYGGGVRER